VPAAGYEQPFSANNPASGTYSGSLTTGRRYVTIFLYYTGVSSTATLDYLVRLTAIRVFSDTAYESGNVSILKADTVVKDARNQATMLLSSEDSQIEADTFNIPMFATGGLKTPREAINAVNAYEDKIVQVDVQKRVVYKQRSTSPDLEIGEWSGADFEDSSANSLGDVSNKVVVEAMGAEGAPARIIRTAGQQSTAMLESISSPAVTNPSFATDLTGWTGSVLTRDTTVFDTTPASLQYTVQTDGTISGTFEEGVTYVLQFRMRSGSAYVRTFASFGDNPAGYNRSATELSPPVGSFSTFQLSWVPSADVSDATLLLTRSSSDPFDGLNNKLWVDTISLFKSTPTIIDRQGFIRTKVLPIRNTQTWPSMTQLGDTWLKSHKTVPFRGGGRATIGGIRRIIGGENLHPSQLGLYTSRLLRLSHRTDPDTGGHGRDGVLASVSYSHNDQSATFSLDDDRQSHETLLERLAVVQSQFAGQ
jgi:hypothetical protein